MLFTETSETDKIRWRRDIYGSRAYESKCWHKRLETIDKHVLESQIRKI